MWDGRVLVMAVASYLEQSREEFQCIFSVNYNSCSKDHYLLECDYDICIRRKISEVMS